MKYVCSNCGNEVEMDANPVECIECGASRMTEVDPLFNLIELDDKELKDIRNAITQILETRAKENAKIKRKRK